MFFWTLCINDTVFRRVCSCPTLKETKRVLRQEMFVNCFSKCTHRKTNMSVRSLGGGGAWDLKRDSNITKVRESWEDDSVGKLLARKA